MSNSNLPLVLKGVGIVAGVISVLALVSQHPIHFGAVVISAGVYFVGVYLEKKSK